MGAAMFLQQKMTPTSADPAQAKMMMMMPIMFTFFMLYLPSGLTLYILVNSILTIAQQWHINRTLKA
jgi:YidC/Oxa1 family membrane protein insertase